MYIKWLNLYNTVWKCRVSKIILFIWSEIILKIFIIYKIIIFHINAVLLKKVHRSFPPKICFQYSIIIWIFFEDQTIIEWFMKDHVMLKTGVVLLKFRFVIKKINYIWQNIKIENCSISNCNNISQYCCLVYFCSINAALKHFFQKHKKYLTWPQNFKL